MGRHYPRRRRGRPRRRLRYRGNGLPARSHCYQDFGLRHLYNLFPPHIRGRDRRLFFNHVSQGMAIYIGVLGGLLGWVMLGPIGALFGFGTGVAFGASYLTKNRHYR